MNLATLDVTKDQAKEALIHYRRAVRERGNAEYDAIRKGYYRIMKGQPLIELSRAIAAGGVDASGRPRLAIMRADEKVCHVEAASNGRVIFSTVRWRDRRRSTRIVFPAGTLPSWGAGGFRTVDARSVVPLIPPQHLPPGALSRYHVLWEASWTDVPSDPALLQHLGGDLYAVLAVWDLTPLEIAVLRGRSNS